MNRLGYLAAICMVATACSTDIRQGSSAAVTDSAGVTIVSTESLEGVPHRLLVGPQVDLPFSQDAADASFSRVGAVLRLEDGRLIISDGASQRLKVFGPDGQFLRMVTAADHAPAEFSAVAAIWTNGPNRISVFDQRQFRLTTLPVDNGSMEVVEFTSVGVRARPVGRLETGDVLVRNLIVDVPDTGLALAHVAVTRFDKSGSLVDTVGVWPSARMGRMGNPPLQLVSGPIFEPRLVTAAAGNSLLVSDCRSGEYRVVDPVRGLKQITRWPTDNLVVSEEDTRLYRSQRLAPLDAAQRPQLQDMLNSMPVSETFPACDRLQIDAQERAWVRSFLRPGAVAQEWLVFGSAGQPLYQIEIPFTSRIMDLGTDHLTVIETDTLSVQRVRVYGIE